MKVLIFSCAFMLVGCQSIPTPTTLPRVSETPPPGTTWAIFQQFEYGFMLWRSDKDCAYVFADASNGQIIIPLDVDRPDINIAYYYCLEAEGLAEIASLTPAPKGLQSPGGVLGSIWGAYETVRTGLGFASAPEQRYAALLPPPPTATFGGGPFSEPLLTLPDGRVLWCGVRAATAGGCHLA